LSIETVSLLLPELTLIALATLIYVAGAFVRARGGWAWAAVVGLLLAAVALYQQTPAAIASALPRFESAGPLALDARGGLDQLAVYARWLALAAGMVLVLTASKPGQDMQEPEFVGTLLLAVCGTMLAAGARELVMLFLGLELVSIPTYVLLYLGRRDAASPEAAVKYFFLSILSSAVTLYGFSFLYGVGGSTQLAKLSAVLSNAVQPAPRAALAAVGLVFVFAGLGFKIAAVPFHFYAPDVYQGTTNGNAGVLAVLPKIAGIVALTRIIAAATQSMGDYHWQITTVLTVLAILTMTVGNALALWQDNVRRLLAYSSIAHAGYMLVGLAVGFTSARQAANSPALDGTGATLFYLAVYVLATAGTFAALSYLGGKGQQVNGVDELAGLGRTHSIPALAIAVFMFSLAGIPPLAGFWGKFNVFASAIGFGLGRNNLPGPEQVWFLIVAAVGVLNAAVAAAYYLRIVAAMYFRAPLAIARAEGGGGAGLAAFGCALLVVGIGLAPARLFERSHDAGQASRTTPAAAAIVDRR
jgi:NADH-quinone oxidoreductase subunit N